MKRVDEYHLTGVKLDIFVGWEHRPPSSGEGRGENKGKPEPKAPPRRRSDATEGLVSEQRHSRPQAARDACRQILYRKLSRSCSISLALS